MTPFVLLLTTFTLRVSEAGNRSKSCKISALSYSGVGEFVVTNGTCVVYLEDDESELVILTPMSSPELEGIPGEVTFGSLKNAVIVPERWRIKR